MTTPILPYPPELHLYPTYTHWLLTTSLPPISSLTAWGAAIASLISVAFTLFTGQFPLNAVDDGY